MQASLPVCKVIEFRNVVPRSLFSLSRLMVKVKWNYYTFARLLRLLIVNLFFSVLAPRILRNMALSPKKYSALNLNVPTNSRKLRFRFWFSFNFKKYLT